MPTLSPEQQSRISILRAKSLDGSITLEEQREAITILRQGRISAAQASESSRRKKATVAIPDADDMLNELENM